MENVTKNNYVLPMFFTKLDRFNITCEDDVTGYNYLSDELKQKFDKLIFLKNTIHVDLLNYLINSNYKISYYSFFGMIDYHTNLTKKNEKQKTDTSWSARGSIDC